MISREYFYGHARPATLKHAGQLSGAATRRGVPDTGRVVKLFVGHGYGYIRLANDREIYFHRADVHEGTSIYDVGVGDTVTFERLDDRVSGARALGVWRQERGR